ncbi:nuclear transport factor 2 family protein [Pedobacter sp. SYP-B3415]|uniref:nuclear transport factor 2 family protein n=1 Tax=Pedobacter sp. SYP-B3415 TaxID=2496641 RepID=UPI00101D3301|nr:nuclear transport factor 2 family protein [Pedobacter sp. SYP-B3415]
MNHNEQLITTFYSAFQRRDFATMQACYGDTAIFNDPVFQDLNAAEVRAMWQMLLESSADLKLRFENVKADGAAGSARWIADYTFSKTGKHVRNDIYARFTFKDGKIATHTDSFSFARWARQSLGLTGWLLGGTTFLKNKIRTEARNRLEGYMRKR